MTRFEHSEYLLALSLVPLMVFLYFAVTDWKRKTATRIGDASLVAQLVRNFSGKQFLFKFALFLVAFVFISIGAANLQSAKQLENVKRQGVDVMIALDVSRSMEAMDVAPNRLERAKILITSLVEKLENDRIGLVIFAGKAYLQMPLTDDHSAARLYIGSATPESVPTQGTVISEALRICNMAFDKDQKKYKTVILITDGEDHDDASEQAARQLAASGVIIHTVGIGSPTGTSIRNPVTGESKRDAEGNVVISKLNEKILQEIASIGKGSYQIFSNSETVAARILQEVGSMEQKSISDTSLLNFRSFFQWFLVIGLVLLVADLFIPEKKLFAK